ncbi:MAG: polyprenyl synthetase family protein [Anaerolineae bacterium]|nr:polyprenyl synthetase family protein [Anaerolineae bacterium]
MADRLQPYLEAVNAALRSLFATPSPELEPLYGMMRYHLGWVDQDFRPVEAPSGKRVRPLICLLSCEAAGGDWRVALPLAAGLELIHNFSLMHDDIEDSSRTRRHRATVWALWGVPQAINTGDAMFTIARRTVLTLADTSVPQHTVLRVLRCVEETSLALCQGQYLDIAFESRQEVDPESYMQMIEGKTAALLACAAETGALVGGAGAASEGYRTFGHELGLAFQMVDDILGIWGDPAVTGKPASDDIRSRKKTLPVLYALRRLAERGDSSLATLLSRPVRSKADVRSVLHCLEAAGARQHTEELAAAHTERALSALERAAPPCPARQALRELALKLVSRVQ